MGHVACMGDEKYTTKISVKNPERKISLESLRQRSRIILREILHK
jgi:hypothetical protein